MKSMPYYYHLYYDITQYPVKVYPCPDKVSLQKVEIQTINWTLALCLLTHVCHAAKLL